MKRDIIDIDSELNIQDYMELDIDAKLEGGDSIALINPSACSSHIYLRALLCAKRWISNICLFNKHTNEFSIIPEHPACSNIEDLRLFDYESKVWFVGFMRNHSTKIFETYVGHFDADCGAVEEIAMTIRADNTHVKNITPLVTQDGRRLWLIDILTGSIYTLPSSEPVAKLNTTLLQQTLSRYTNDVYGTTQYIHLYDNLYGGLVHITKRIGSRIYYVYVWIEIDVERWTIVFVSKPYIIRKLGIIFVSHIEKIDDEKFQIMFGQDDEVTCRAITTLRDLRGL